MKTLNVLADGVTAHKFEYGEYIIFHRDADGSEHVAFGWPTEADGRTLKYVRGSKKPVQSEDPDLYWRLEPIGEVVYAYERMTDAQYTLRSYIPDGPTRRVCVWKEETAVKDVMACDLATLEANRAAVSAMIPEACCERCRGGLRAMAAAYKKYNKSVLRNDRDETRWRRCAELCRLVGDRAGEAAAMKRANKAAALAEVHHLSVLPESALPPPLPPTATVSVPRSAMSAAAKKHLVALKKHGEGSRQEARARRGMLEFEAILAAA